MTISVACVKHHLVTLSRNTVFCSLIQDNDFDGTTGLLSGSLKRINNMVNAGKSNRRLMCYLILILVVLFFVLFYLVTWLRSGSWTERTNVFVSELPPERFEWYTWTRPINFALKQLVFVVRVLCTWFGIINLIQTACSELSANRDVRVLMHTRPVWCSLDYDGEALALPVISNSCTERWKSFHDKCCLGYWMPFQSSQSAMLTMPNPG
jgi:hypothetical protein